MLSQLSEKLDLVRIAGLVEWCLPGFVGFDRQGLVSYRSKLGSAEQWLNTVRRKKFVEIYFSLLAKLAFSATGKGNEPVNGVLSITCLIV